MTLDKHLGELSQAGLGAARDVEDLVGDVGLSRQDVGAGDVLDVDEVHGLLAVAEDHRRLARVDALHPADQHLGVDAVDVHARPVDVEVAQGHVVEAVHVVEAAQQALVEDLGRPVEGPVVVGVVGFRGRELLRHPVDGGGGGGDDLLHLVFDAQLQEVKGGVDHDLHGVAWVLGALGDAQGGHVKDQVRVADQLLHEGAVADVGLDQADPSGGHGICEVLRAGRAPCCRWRRFRSSLPAPGGR